MCKLNKQCVLYHTETNLDIHGICIIEVWHVLIFKYDAQTKMFKVTCTVLFLLFMLQSVHAFLLKLAVY